MLLFSVPGTRLSFRARLLAADNPAVVDLVRSQLPLTSVLGHTVVSGETFWTPTRTLFLESGYMVERKPGAVYYHSPGQTICVCYGGITESATVNQFAQVLEEDFEDMEAIGKLVYQQTMEAEIPTIVRIEIRLVGGDGSTGLVTELDPPPLSVSGDHWRSVKAQIEKETDEVWLEEPEEFRKIRLGVVEAGTGGQSFSVLVLLDTCLMMYGANIVYRILQLAQRTTFTMDDVKAITHAFLIETFNHFDFLKDLGLPSMARVGRKYSEALNTVTEKAEFIELTGALVMYLTRMHRWVQFIFPWHIGRDFPHRALADIEGIPKLQTYSAPIADDYRVEL